MGLTDLGYQRRTFDDILNAKIQRAKELFGEDIDVSDQGPLGKYLRINAYDQAISEEETEAVYYASKPNTASGQSLDHLVALGGISRNAATTAVYSVNVQGTAGYVIPAGFLVGTETDLTFYTASESVIGADGTCVVTVECTELGIGGNVNAAAINQVVNPDANVASVTGAECLSAAVDEESDAALRTRLKSAMSGAGGSNENAIRAALLRIPTVQYAAVTVNDGNTEDSEGRPAHSFECYVLGGDDYHQQIAEAIFAARPIGIQTAGDIAVAVIDACGNEKTIRFSNTPATTVMVKVKVKTDNSFPGDGAALIQQNVSEYINGLGVGVSLSYSAIFGHIYAITGVLDVPVLELSTDGGSSYSTGNVTVPQYGVIACGSVSVEVTA